MKQYIHNNKLYSPWDNFYEEIMALYMLKEDVEKEMCNPLEYFKETYPFNTFGGWNLWNAWYLKLLQEELKELKDLTKV